MSSLLLVCLSVLLLGILIGLWLQRRHDDERSTSERTRRVGTSEDGGDAEDAQDDATSKGHLDEWTQISFQGDAPQALELAEKSFPAKESALPDVVPKQILRWVEGVSPPLVPMVPNAIPTSYRGRVEVVHGPKGTVVCQHLPHPGGKDYLLFDLEDMPLAEDELRRAQRRGATVVVTLQNGRVTSAQIPRQLDWGRGLWQQRSGHYRGR